MSRFFRFSEPPQSERLNNKLIVLGLLFFSERSDQLLREGCFDRARCNGVDPHSPWTELEGQCFSQ